MPKEVDILNGIKINFDACHNPEEPTIVIAKKNGEKINGVHARNITVHGSLNSPSELAFNIYKELDSISDEMWEEIIDFRLVWCKEWNKWFEAHVELSESDKLIKTVSCVGLGEAELSQIMLYGIEINTDIDISRDDYSPTKLYWQEKPHASLLHRLLEKAPHYTISHVDYTLMSMQRSYTFDGVSVYDAFKTIAEEMDALFVLDVQTDGDGNIKRVISVYDLESYCNHCGHRGVFDDDCPTCGSDDIHRGYGEDTTVFVSSEQIAEKIQLTTDNKAVKNCFKLEAGDDLMTATIRNCNPNGTDYLWYISEAQKKDMSKELVAKIENYNTDYEYYQSQKQIVLNQNLVSQYNAIVAKYANQNKDLNQIVNPAIGYTSLIGIYYDTVDLALYLRSVMSPKIEIVSTNAKKEASLLTNNNMSPVAVTNISSLTQNSANSAVLSLAKTIVNPKYRVRIITSSLIDTTWTGKFSVENYGNEEDVSESGTVAIRINSDYKTFVEQKIKRALHDKGKDNLSITALFEMSLGLFKQELKKYSLNYLNLFFDCCQSCIDILIEQGIANKDTWSNATQNLYDVVYIPYYEKLNAIQDELLVRQNEIEIIIGKVDEGGVTKKEGVQTSVINAISEIQSFLNFETYLRKDLWLEFSTFRREDKFSNPNYISDGLSNKELLENAENFIKVAKKELYKSAELQRSVSVSLKNVFMADGFEPLFDHFEVGNWIRVLIDGEVYKLRLIDFEVDYDNTSSAVVSFSDVIKDGQGGCSDIQSILNQASAMASSYDSVKRQSEKGKNSNKIIENWFESGMDATNVRIMSSAENQEQIWDGHGMLFRRFDPIIDDYDDTQLKIINSTLAVTTDNWKTTKTAIGKFLYRDAISGELVEAYGVNAEVVVGKLIIGKTLAIYNTGNTFKVDEDGLMITNGINTVTINPNDDSVFTLHKGEDTLISLNEDGTANFAGHLNAITISTGGKTSKSANSNGIFIDSGGSLYGGFNNQFVVNADGTFDFANGGIVYNGTTLTISAWTIGDDAIYRVNKKFGEANGMYFGISGLSISDKFFVTSGGFLKAVNADLSGNINAQTGTIGGSDGFTIIAGKLYSGIHSSYNTAANGVYIGTDYISLGNGGVSWLRNDGAFQLGGSSGIKYNGSTITLGSNVSIAWDNLSESDSHITTITKNTVTTKYVNALNVTAGSVAAENITGTTITGKTFKGCTGDFTGKITATSGYIGGITGWRITTNVIRSIRKFDDYYYEYYMQSPNRDYTTNAFAVRRTLQTPISGSSSADWVFEYDQGETWDYPFRVSYTGTTHIQKLYVNDSQIISDKKIKAHIEYMNEDIASIEEVFYSLQPTVYSFKDTKTLDDKLHMGFYAQDVHKAVKTVYPEYSFGIATAFIKGEEDRIADVDNVQYDDKSLNWSLSYSEIIAPTVAIVQKHHREIVELTEKYDKLLELFNQLKG